VTVSGKMTARQVTDGLAAAIGKVEPSGHDNVCAFDDNPFGPDGKCAAGHTREESEAYEAHCAALAHDCPREAFLDDPITQAYGVGYEMVGLVRCPVCEAREAG
jgi:hypothetical protein